jgi:hypothetical protein
MNQEKEKEEEEEEEVLSIEVGERREASAGAEHEETANKRPNLPRKEPEKRKR